MDLKTWAPFQSTLESQICARMTTEEKEKVVQFGSVTGLFVAVFIAIPLGFGVSFGVTFGLFAKHPWALVIMVGWITVGILLLMRRRQMARELLCSTQWAKQMGYKPEDLKKR
ncbi:MAG: hypothetical protein A2031_02215 [Deltaproteobacteria bacterium RBG_19FT_COMBO_43_11]|nr:MAG: hypothetical protein A2031_02215 [Deltaproteobacteria bacterium RBG_19FT_COMBO_43_11]